MSDTLSSLHREVLAVITANNEQRLLSFEIPNQNPADSEQIVSIIADLWMLHLNDELIEIGYDLDEFISKSLTFGFNFLSLLEPLLIKFLEFVSHSIPNLTSLSSALLLIENHLAAVANEYEDLFYLVHNICIGGTSLILNSDDVHTRFNKAAVCSVIGSCAQCLCDIRRRTDTDLPRFDIDVIDTILLSRWDPTLFVSLVEMMLRLEPSLKKRHVGHLQVINGTFIIQRIS